MPIGFLLGLLNRLLVFDFAGTIKEHLHYVSDSTGVRYVRINSYVFEVFSANMRDLHTQFSGTTLFATATSFTICSPVLSRI